MVVADRVQIEIHAFGRIVFQVRFLYHPFKFPRVFYDGYILRPAVYAVTELDASRGQPGFLEFFLRVVNDSAQHMMRIFRTAVFEQHVLKPAAFHACFTVMKEDPHEPCKL